MEVLGRFPLLSANQADGRSKEEIQALLAGGREETARLFVRRREDGRVREVTIRRGLTSLKKERSPSRDATLELNDLVDSDRSVTGRGAKNKEEASESWRGAGAADGGGGGGGLSSVVMEDSEMESRWRRLQESRSKLEEEMRSNQRDRPAHLEASSSLFHLPDRRSPEERTSRSLAGEELASPRRIAAPWEQGQQLANRAEPPSRRFLDFFDAKKSQGEAEDSRDLSSPSRRLAEEDRQTEDLSTANLSPIAAKGEDERHFSLFPSSRAHFSAQMTSKAVPDHGMYSPRRREEETGRRRREEEKIENEEEEKSIADLRMKNFDLFSRSAATPAKLSSPRQEAAREQRGGRREERRESERRRRQSSSTLLLTLDRDFDRTCSTASSMQSFKDALVRDCAESLQVAQRQVEVISVERGSILVKLLLLSDLLGDELEGSLTNGRKRTSEELARELRNCVSNPMSILCQRHGAVRAQLLPELQGAGDRRRTGNWEATGRGESQRGGEGESRREQLFLPSTLKSPRQGKVEEPTEETFPLWMRDLMRSNDEQNRPLRNASSSSLLSSSRPRGPPSMSVRELRKHMIVRPVAVARVTVHRARDLVASNRWSSCYCLLSLRHQESFTGLQDNTSSPQWNFSSSLPVYDLSDKIRISVIQQRVSSSSSPSSSSPFSSSCQEIGHIALPIRMAESLVELRSSWYVLQDEQEAPVSSNGAASALCVSLHVSLIQPEQEDVSRWWKEGWAEVRREEGAWQRVRCFLDPWGPRLVCFSSPSDLDPPALVVDLRKFHVDSSSVSSKFEKLDLSGARGTSSFPFVLAICGEERGGGRGLPAAEASRGYVLLDGLVFLGVMCRRGGGGCNVTSAQVERREDFEQWTRCLSATASFHVLNSWREEDAAPSSSSSAMEFGGTRVFDERFHVLDVAAPGPATAEQLQAETDKSGREAGRGEEEGAGAQVLESAPQSPTDSTKDFPSPPPPPPPLHHLSRRPWQPSKTVCAMGFTIFVLLLILIIILSLYV
ncbi:hypothetical protein GUITHDRAFT_136962 [Guillardia theta CCMP2712]|uniref:C2 domain-containing protein n=1 Tax=Guillardia theta (strain CCMP2712) TaxID=905079 RepID=L1JIL8_GUITC|nr:hypothetical protein GUITHDRAFT_136962 [Guillardia theta CCMP2712]EKX47999.1 hypothetical protein GUITHDRAFT_136962 [Guillardia theta CCMP2712]|eukprot:XP_005834979.1 hypothetical protein GUITHDRAFT_136962 [Guillardia theta CCMP2712]